MRKTITTALIAVTAAAAMSACAATETTTTTGGQVTGSTTAHKKAGPSYTVAQENAIRSANAYLSMGNGFSRAGLIGQLSSKAGEGFKRSLAVFAVNHIKVNWNQQAVLSAKAYLKMSGFSRAGLISQLSSAAGEQFTVAQATYAANHVGL